MCIQARFLPKQEDPWGFLKKLSFCWRRTMRNDGNFAFSYRASLVYPISCAHSVILLSPPTSLETPGRDADFDRI